MARVLILENAPATQQRWAGESLSDRAVEAMAAAIAAALTGRGHAVGRAPVGLDPRGAIDAVRVAAPEVVFQLCETMCGNARLEPALPYLLGWLGIPFTGNPADVMALLLDKARTKQVLLGLGLPTPEFVSARAEGDLDGWAAWPAILKPAAEDASLGIDRGSVVDGATAARERFRLLAGRFGVPVLVERFIAGRELNVAMLETPDGVRVGINEIDFSALPADHPRILTYEAKWEEESDVFRQSPPVPAQLPAALDAEVRRLARAAWEGLGLRGYARVDFRVDEAGRPFILEVNPNPDLSEGAGFAKSLPQMGVTYPEAVELIVRAALAAPKGTSMSKPSASAPATASATASPAAVAAPAGQMTVRALRPVDRDPIEKILRGTGFFHEDEVLVALELVDEALHKPHQQDYFFGVGEVDGRVAGYVCYGRRDMTVHTWDLFWVAVDATLQKRGTGRVLMNWAEERMREQGCRVVIVETAGRPQYEPTRAFYLRIGYQEEARIKDFYADGDDLVIYTKHFPPRP
ncbi:MAG: GNAT family N-acetyltransferase [Candidatus Riflebacteria bacterium]|nr:GNAT family N-acetyltransferase [Candidatus Riflebacteria bacterium]